MIEKAEEKYIQEGARKVQSRDFLTVIKKADQLRARFRGRGPLNRFVEDGRLMLGIIKDYWARRYRQVPYGIIAAVVFVLIYVINPFDIVPDFLPIIGEIDDAAIVGASLLAVERDLFKYRDWKQAQAPALPEPSEPLPEPQGDTPA
ncbi:MAG TPA: DUF1232 domain-containing protein [Anaerolineales bacterium]